MVSIVHNNKERLKLIFHGNGSLGVPFEFALSTFNLEPKSSSKLIFPSLFKGGQS